MRETNLPQGEITCLFTEREGATALRKALPGAEFQRLVAEHNDLLCTVFQETGGIVVDERDAQFSVAFALAADALNCAVTLQERLFEARNALRAEATEGAMHSLQVRIGVYTAHPDFFRTPDGQYAAHESNLALRIGAYGIGGQILVSERTRQSGDTYPADWWKTHPNRYLRDIDSPETLHELLWDGRTGRPEPGSCWIPTFLLQKANTFIGRKAERQTILQWLRGDSPLLLLHGPAGIGKTRLAAQAALAVSSLYRGYVFGIPLDREFLENAEEVTPLQLARAIAHAVDAPARIQKSEKPDAVLNYLERRFASDPFLLILDNFESVANAETRAFLADLTEHVSQIRCLVTCRNSFRIPDESESLEIVGLSVPTQPDHRLSVFESVPLFQDRAQQQRATPDLCDTEALVPILSYTEGNPLAIELLAARTGEYSCPRIVDGLRWSHLDWELTATETGGIATEATRTSRLESCIEWTFQMLPSAEWRLYPRLGLFPAEFDAQATADIADISEQMLLRWSRLHLLDWSEETRRATLPPVLREFARRRLPQEELPSLQTRFVAYYAGLVKTRIKNAFQPDQLDVEAHNLRLAAQFLCTQQDTTPEDAKKLIALGIALNTMCRRGHTAYRAQAVRCLHTALTVVTEEKYPRQWAQIQHLLGYAHSTLQNGERSRDLHHAIACYRAALTIRTEERMSREWAQTQFKLGNAYLHLPDGDKNLNVHLAIDCYRAALRVYTEQNAAKEWADAQHNLGLACAKLPNEDKSLYLLEAIDCYKSALCVFTQQEYPTDWAMAQNNLGNAYVNLRLGNQGENIQEALAYYKEALAVYTEQDHPEQWAMVQTNIGLAYGKLPAGDRAENLRQAITSYQAALRVRSEYDCPENWAAVQHNLGNAYFNLPGAGSAENLRHAIACYRTALAVRTEEEHTEEWAMTQHNLGLALWKAGEQESAMQAFALAIRGYQTLGLTETVADIESRMARRKSKMTMNPILLRLIRFVRGLLK